VKISEVTRRDIIGWMVDSELPLCGRLGVAEFVVRFLALAHGGSLSPRDQAVVDAIAHHYDTNSASNKRAVLEQKLRLPEIDDAEFCHFLAVYASPVVRQDAEEVERIVASLNPMLAPDGYGLVAVEPVSGRAVYECIETGAHGRRPGAAEYDVALSFAGEDREYAEQVAKHLEENGLSVFYDGFEVAKLWGKDLVAHLHDIYCNRARYCMVFVSKHYAEKAWPTLEARAALERSLRERDEYILPVRIDQTEVPGLPSTVAYISATQHDPRQVADLFVEKLRGSA